MVRFRRDNERLMLEQEKILKSLSNKKNKEMEHPSVDRGMHEGDEQQKRDNTTERVERSPSQWSNKKKNYNEVESSNLSDQQEVKKHKLELQGEFQKRKPPTFDGEAEEVADAWLINMKIYF